MKRFLAFFLGFALCVGMASPAFAALAVDAGSSTGATGTGGSNANTQTTLATGATLTLNNSQDIIIVAISLEKEAAGTPGCTSVTDGTNTYTLRNRISYSIASATAAQVTLELWWAYSPTTLTTATVTATCGTASGFTNGEIIAWGVTGFTGTAYHTNPWDQSAATALTWAASSNSTTASAIVSNSYSNVSANAMLIGIAGTSSLTVMNSGDIATLAGASTTITNALNNTTFGNNSGRLDFTTLVIAATDTGTATMNVGRTYAGWAVMPDILAQAGGSTGGAPPTISVFNGLGL